MGPKVTSLLLLGLVLCYASEIKTVRKSNHGHYVCSTWGNNHFKTFDGDFYQFPGICDYNFASDCRDTYKEFSVHIQREQNDELHPNIQYVLVAIKDVAIYLTHKRVVVDGQTVKTPYYSSGVLIEKNDIYTKLYAKLGLILIWNQADALMIELDSKFNNLTCGLCGDYNGQQIYNEFISDGLSYNPITFGNLQKINNLPTKCEDPDETKPIELCNQHREECKTLLTSPAFADCQNRLNLELYIQACMHDRCACKHTEDSFCLCSSISEYSRQCSHAGGKPQNWRTHQLCPKSCPKNMIYLESGSPCMDSCSHLEISKLCEEHYMDGCFCPKGTVYDDVTGNGCVLTSQCHCKLHGKTFSPGQKITNECEKCTCQSGRWICQELPCPSTCALEGGSHITTFDGKKYTFHGDCYYVLTKTTKNDTYVLLGELGPCSSSDKQTCLKSVVLLTDQRKNVVVFKSDGTILQNEMEIHLPYRTGSFSVFQPSSFYTIVHTIYGLKMQIQLSPVMQLFLIVEQSIKGTIHGLCGDYNGIEGDDFKTSGGVVEATGASFANSWKAQASCSDMEDKLEHPCSLSLENEKYAEFWCSLLKSATSPFARCHSVIDPVDYYKRCKYDTCNCNSNEECLCAALSSYARACAFKGVMLWGWRNVICNKEVNSCPANQVFRYNLTMCQQSCRSLSNGNKYCLEGFTPVDGCGCPDNSYVNEKGICVPMAACSCHYKGLYVQPGDNIMKGDKRCVCKDGRFQCVIVDKRPPPECPSNKIYFNCTDFDSWSSQTPVQLSCQTLGTDYVQTECISGCFCPEGLIDDGQGGCVVEDDCPCIHNQVYYSNGEKINVDCNTCTCQKGNWNCTTMVCHGTCTIYGSGHYITFDGKFYDFVGNCEYVASQDYCGNQQGMFSVITENVLCGTTGVTCTKAIKLFLGTTELKLQEKHIEKIEWTNNSSVTYWIQGTVGLYTVIEASNGLMVIWDKKTTIFIKLLPYHKGKVCGLCGNFDGKASNDFTTRSMAQDTVSALTFGNSWKKDPACPDVGGIIEPCELKPHRKTWAEKECSLIKSEVFKICHHKVDPQPYYEACVHDACSCDTGGDCECFCTAVATYAHECIKAEACIHWRTPDICPIFCEYYNPSEDICEWHYEPCGREILTCKIVIQGSSNFSVPFLEGCYPRCSPDYPIYDEETKSCVDKCGCYFNGTYYLPGSLIPNYEPREPCHNCYCQSSGNVMCKLEKECCVYDGKEYEVNETVVDKTNECLELICTLNGTMEIKSNRCTSTISPSTIPTTTSSTTTITTTMYPTSTTTVSTTGTSTIVSTPCLNPICEWFGWISVSIPEIGITKGDNETYENIRLHNITICEKPENISCRSKKFPEVSLEDLQQTVTCNVSTGLICKNEDQVPGIVIPAPVCLDYEINVLCCVCPPNVESTTTRITTTPSTPTPTPTPTSTSTTESPTTTITTTPTTPTPTPTTTSTTESPTTTITTTPSTPTPTPTPTSTSTTESPTTTITTTPTTPTPTPTPTITSTTESPTTTITTTSSTPTPTPTPTTTSTTESPTTTITTTPTTPTPTPTTTSTTESPTTTITTTSSTPTPTPTITSTTESPTTTITTTSSTPTPTPTPTITSTTESPTTTITTTPSTPTPTPTITSTTESPTTTITTTSSTPTPTPTPTITSTTESPTTTITTTPSTPTPTPTITSTTESPTTTITTTSSTPTPTPTITSTTESPTTTITTTPSTPTPTPTPTITSTTESPTTTITTTPSTPTPTPTITSTTESPTTTITTTPTTPTPTPTITSTTESPTTTITTTPSTPTPTPTPTITSTTESPTTTITTTPTTPTPTPTTTSTTESPTTTITTTPSTPTPTPTPTITSTTESPTTTITTTSSTPTPTPTPTITSTTESPTTTITTTPTPTPTPITTSTTESPTPTITTTPSTPTPTPTTITSTTESPTTTITTTSSTPTPTPTPTPTITSTTESPTPTITTTPTPTPTSTTTSTTESPTTTITTTPSTPTPTPTPTITSTTESPTTTITTTPSSPTPTPTSTITSTTESPTTTITTTPTPTLTPTTTSTTESPTTTTSSTPTPTPTITSTTESPTTTITTTPFTPTPTPTPTITSTTESPTTTITTTPTPTPTPTTTSTTESPTTTTSSTPTPTPTITSTTESPTTTITTTPFTPTPTPTPTITSTTESPTTTITTTPTPTPTPTTTSTTESPTTTTSSTPTPNPTITSTTESPTTTITTTPSTPTPTPTPTITSTTESPTTTITTTPSTPTPSSTPCYCVVNGVIYYPGETITSSNAGGMCSVTSCSFECQVVTHNWPCSTTATTTVTSTAPTSTTQPPCEIGDHIILPGESGGICNCTELRCVTGNLWKRFPVECEPSIKPKCANGLAPVEVLDENGCCPHWECDCYCTGWGDPHYMTFDGHYYSYQGNCTYVLMEEINHTIYNFGVYIDNYHCDPAQSVSCTRTLTIKHESQEVRLKTVKLIPMKVEVTVNHEQVGLPYEKYSLKVYKSGINYVVELFRLKMNVTYNGMAFTIRLPYATFANNTQGQCGKCNNNIQDDCMLRNETVIPSCEIMADDWVINDPEKPHCGHMPPPVKPQRPDICPTPSQLCELLKGSIFQKCHAVVNVTSYYEACIFDSCRMPNESMECASLQIYAATCADQGVCIDWRGHTKGACPVICLPHKVYKACGPTIEETCKSGLIEQNQTRQMEGCFCPEGTKLYDTAKDVCVETCGCVGPDNIPRKFGENFQFDCQNCICMEGGSGIICEPYTCPIPDDEIQCEGEGYQKSTKINPNDKCCSDIVCVCNTTQCTTKPPQCDPGFIAVANNTEEHCCPSYQCNPKEVCVKDGNEYKPGSEVLGGQCEECTCTNQQNSTTLLNIIECKEIPCNVKCQEGYSPVRLPGDCCPKCMQTSCVIRTIENEILILTPGESQNDPKDNCTLYTCTRIHRQLISSTSVITCPSFDEKRCQPGTLVYLPNGCCKTCILMPGGSSCSPTQTMDYINYNGCRSEEQVPVTQCEGRCGTFSLYSPEANSMTHKCSCCRESKTSRKEIMLMCPGGIRKKHRYIHVDRCECLNTECGDEQSSSEESREIKKLTTQQPQEEKVMERVKKALRHAAKRS
ncbi:mucin-2 isoform X2 [Crotalus tigris]|uniref:mucin-2 isoform X2 n=1 Tax=Crotalus tigris TaxID=88082 RepID=UPI00192F4C1B|nr:mucin-2 isoform X2 [Crotalus tigris]